MIVHDRPADFVAIETEAEARLHLCAVYRLLAHFGMDDTIYTHVSARIPGQEAFLINPFGLMFEEITPRSLVAVDFEGRVLDNNIYAANAAGFVIHGGILRRRPDLACVLHTHTRAGVALSCLDEGLLPLNQFAIEFSGAVGYHDYEGIAFDLDEGVRLHRDLGDHVALVLRNHGLLTVGQTIPAAFYFMYYLEQSARVQMDVLGSGHPFSTVSPEILARTDTQFTSRREAAKAGHRMWPAMLRLLDRHYPAWSEE
jgi:ribulose-5-phosphate 4-epimerase/fuculose-1-phosphate aldolase